MTAAARAHPRFVTFEGVDGAGKSTHVAWFAQAIASRTGVEVVLTREPGGTPVGEALRTLVLATPMDIETEALLLFAARRQHLVDVIEPALARGAWVVCDRFTDATYAYQGGGRGLPAARIDALRDWVHPHLEPGHVLLFDLDPAVAKGRIEASARDHDRFEGEAVAFFDRVRAAYLERAAAGPSTWHVLDGAKTIAQLRQELENIVASICSQTGSIDETVHRAPR